MASPPQPELLGLLDLDAIERELAERHLSDFARQAWHVVEPGTRLSWTWHLDAICDHLEAVTRGEVRNLVINMPPRCMKSLLVSVFWPVWSWLRRPETRWLFSSYAASLAIRDSLKCRRIIESPWFQARWSRRFRLTSDQNAKQRFENDRTGYRIATSVGGATTGEGAGVVVCDDPHNVMEALSDAERSATLTWWDEAMSTRLDDPATGARVIVMQRLHEDDLAGHVLAQGGYEHLCLPMEFEPERRCTTRLGWTDPRSAPGDLLWPERFSPESLADLSRAMGEYAYAGQMQQRPSPRTGGMFKVERFGLVSRLPSGAPALPDGASVVSSVRYWDKAGTQDGGKFSAGVRIDKLSNGRFLVRDVVRGQWSALRREEMIRLTARLDGVSVRIWTEQEPGSGGKESAEGTIRGLAGYNVRADKVTGDKRMRAEPFSVQVEAGNVDIIEAEWNHAFTEELRVFDAGRFTDQVDAASGAFAKLQTPSGSGIVHAGRMTL